MLGTGGDPGQHRVEPPRDAAVQRIVVAALEMRLVRLALDRLVRACAERGVPALPVASAVRHVSVQPEVVPASGEGGPIGHRPDDATHFGSGREGKALGRDAVHQVLHERLSSIARRTEIVFCMGL